AGNADLPRLSLLDVSGAGVMPARLADLLFHCPDDVMFSREGDERPEASVSPSGALQFEGKFSWLMTVAPPGTEDLTPYSSKRYWKVDVVVFRGRNPVYDDVRTASLVSSDIGGCKI